MAEPDASAMAMRWTYIAWLEAEAGRMAEKRPGYAAELRAIAAERRALAARESQANLDVPTRTVSG